VTNNGELQSNKDLPPTAGRTAPPNEGPPPPAAKGIAAAAAASTAVKLDAADASATNAGGLEQSVLAFGVAEGTGDDMESVDGAASNGGDDGDAAAPPPV
jgi:hypothetical protein